MFARVALPLAVPDALTYSVPAEWQTVVQPGVRVRVELRGAPRVGLVVATAEETDLPAGRILPVRDVLDSEPIVPGHVLDLAAFVADYYAAPVGTVVRAVVPPRLLQIPPVLVQPGPTAAELAPGLEAGPRRLLERILAAGRISVARLRSEGWSGSELTETLESLAARHAVQVVERRPGIHAGGAVGAVTLTELDEEERSRRVGRAPAQQRVTAWLVALGRPALESELLAGCECSAGVVAELVRKGIVRRFQQARRAAPRRWELAPAARPTTLTSHQEQAVSEIGAAIGERRFRPCLLLGVTGSGKTEVYLRLAAAAADRGLQTVILVPEIGLTPALAGELSGRFGDRVAVLHSSMAEGDRLVAWQRARRGDVDVVAGPRSALWAPLPRPGLLVVDEEQDPSYKQDEEPRYHARDVALMYGQQLSLPVVLASATPSLEVLALAEAGRLRVLRLPERVAGGQLPAVEVVDLRGEQPEPSEHGQRFVSARLRELLGETLARGEQAILLVNRRGWAPVLLCRECGSQHLCRDCSIPMTVHRRRGALVCHYCGFVRDIPERCSECGGAVLDHIGAGTEKISARVREMFPSARVAVLDRDTARSPAQLVATLESFAAGETEVLVGTQMVSKGHHFPRVTLTAVVNADNLLGFPDFRGAERTFHMLTQVAGRAGRGPRPGSVVIQTYHPDHHAIRAAVGHDAERFAVEEMRFRRAFRYPPLARLALLRFESATERSAYQAAEATAAALEPRPAGLRVLGPTAAPLARLRGKWRVQLMLLAESRQTVRDALARALAAPVPRAVHRVVDVDPQTTV